MIPQRILRSRVKGWRMPENTVSVGRPSRWGNPFDISQYGRERAVRMHADWICEQVRIGAIDLSPLRGKHLACWCLPGKLCHADTLLKLANQGAA